MGAELGVQQPGSRGALSRRAVLKLGLGALAAGWSLDALPAWAARPSRIDEAAIRRLFEETAKGLLVPGACMILRAPGVDLSLAYGSSALAGGRAVGPHDRFRIGSVTKTFTGTVVLQAIQDGVGRKGDVKLSDPVSRYRPDVPNGSRISIEQLLTMHSGLYNYTLSLPLNKALDRDPQRVWSTRDLLRIAYAGRRHPIPGKTWEYSNTNTVLLGLIAEHVFGAPLAVICEQRLFRRLGMRDTSLPAPSSSAIPGPHPRGYMFGTNVSTLKTEKLPADQIAAAEAGQLKPRDVTVMNPSWAGAAGAGISTAQDLATWAKGLCDGSLLDAHWQHRRLASVRAIDPAEPSGPGYGLGLAKFGALYGHTGELPGFQTFAGHDPGRGLTLVVWTNLKASPRGFPCAATIARTVIDELYRAHIPSAGLPPVGSA